MLMKMPMPAPGSSELPLFNGENATRWLHLYDAMAKDRYLTEGERAARLPDFCDEQWSVVVEGMQEWKANDWSKLKEQIKVYYYKKNNT